MWHGRNAPHFGFYLQSTLGSSLGYESSCTMFTVTVTVRTWVSQTCLQSWVSSVSPRELLMGAVWNAVNEARTSELSLVLFYSVAHTTRKARVHSVWLPASARAASRAHLRNLSPFPLSDSFSWPRHAS